jgi:hypothetical protein
MAFDLLVSYVNRRTVILNVVTSRVKCWPIAVRGTRPVCTTNHAIIADASAVRRGRFQTRSWASFRSCSKHTQATTSSKGRLSRSSLGFCERRLDKGVTSQHPALNSALVQCLAMPFLASVPDKVSIEAAHGATEAPARRLPQRAMGTHEAIGLDFEAQGRCHVAASGRETMPRVGRQDNRPVTHVAVHRCDQVPS